MTTVVVMSSGLCTFLAVLPLLLVVTGILCVWVAVNADFDFLLGAGFVLFVLGFVGILLLISEPRTFDVAPERKAAVVRAIKPYAEPQAGRGEGKP